MRSAGRSFFKILDGLEKESAGSGTQAQSRTPTAWAGAFGLAMVDGFTR